MHQPKVNQKVNDCESHRICHLQVHSLMFLLHVVKCEHDCTWRLVASVLFTNVYRKRLKFKPNVYHQDKFSNTQCNVLLSWHASAILYLRLSIHICTYIYSLYIYIWTVSHIEVAKSQTIRIENSEFESDCDPSPTHQTSHQVRTK